MNEQQIQTLRRKVDAITDIRQLRPTSAGFVRHPGGFNLTPDHVLAAQESSPLLRAEGAFQGHAKSPYKRDFTYAVVLVEASLAQRYLSGARAIAAYSVKAAPCLEASYRQAWMQGNAHPDPMHVYAYLRDQAGLAIDERVVSSQACIDVPEGNATLLLFWVVASRSPGEPDYKMVIK